MFGIRILSFDTRVLPGRPLRRVDDSRTVVRGVAVRGARTVDRNGRRTVFGTRTTGRNVRLVPNGLRPIVRRTCGVRGLENVRFRTLERRNVGRTVVVRRVDGRRVTGRRMRDVGRNVGFRIAGRAGVNRGRRETFRLVRRRTESNGPASDSAIGSRPANTAARIVIFSDFIGFAPVFE